MGKVIIESADLHLKDGSLTQITDATGQWYYRVPISCINEPLRYVPGDEVADKDQYEKQDLKDIKVRNNQFGDHSFSLSNLSSVEDLKNKFLDKIGEKDLTLRFLYGGKEMKDGQCLAHYNV